MTVLTRRAFCRELCGCSCRVPPRGPAALCRVWSAAGRGSSVQKLPRAPAASRPPARTLPSTSDLLPWVGNLFSPKPHSLRARHEPLAGEDVLTLSTFRCRGPKCKHPVIFGRDRFSKLCSSEGAPGPLVGSTGVPGGRRARDRRGSWVDGVESVGLWDGSSGGSGGHRRGSPSS